MYNLLKKRTCQGCGYEEEEQDCDRGRHDDPPEGILKKNIVEGILVLSHDLGVTLTFCLLSVIRITPASDHC